MSYNSKILKYMAKKKKTKEVLSNEQKWGIGVGLTAAAVAATGAYFLYGSKHAEENRKKVHSWMLKAKAEVLEGLERAQSMTQKEYEDLVNTIGAAYAGLQEASQKDIREFKKEMKAHWQTIEQLATDPLRKKGATKAKKTTKKTAKATKKTAKSTKSATKKKAKKTTTKKK